MIFNTLVSNQELAKHLNDPAWRIFDCRHQLTNPSYGENAYAASHIPGASFLHLDRDLSGKPNGKNGRHPLPEAIDFASFLGKMGVSDNTQLIVYDDAGGMIAARLWWMLRWLGHDQVAVLDGGFPGWQKAGLPVTPDLPTFSPQTFVPKIQDWVVNAEEVAENIQNNLFCLVDARSPDRFRGENETIDPVAGRIPGARNRHHLDNLNQQGFFRPAPELNREFLAVLSGYTPKQSVMQCGSGVSACHNLLAMEIAGLSGARLYAGSWSEWCADPARPVSR